MTFILFTLLLMALPFISVSQELQCHIKGECNGVFVGLSEQENYNACLETCKTNDLCNFFTFTEGIHSCMHYKDCPGIDTNTCQDCYSGQKNCELEASRCDNPGFCDGHVVSLSVTTNSNECLALCQTFPECNYYSYFTSSNYCVLTEDCLMLDTSCTDCIAGERSCYHQEDALYGKLFIVGGINAYYKVELVDLTSENKTCPQFPDHPDQRETVGTYIDGKAMVCGGAHPPTDACRYYEKRRNIWVQTESMMETRQGATAVMMSPTQWWVTGGIDSSLDPLSSTEIYTVGEGFVPYVDLPEATTLHNLVQVNSTHFVLLGEVGNSDSIKAWMFDSSLEIWTSLPDLQEEREITHAGLVTYPNGTQAIIVAGGRHTTNYSKTSEILDLSSSMSSWHFGPDLPVDLYAGASVPHNNSFIIVSGYSDRNGYMKTIISYDPTTEDWVELPQKMEQGRTYFAAFLVPDDFAECK